MKSFPFTATYIFLTSAGIIAFARWLHPASFSPHILTALLTLFAVSTVFYLLRYE